MLSVLLLSTRVERTDQAVVVRCMAEIPCSRLETVAPLVSYLTQRLYSKMAGELSFLYIQAIIDSEDLMCKIQIHTCIHKLSNLSCAHWPRTMIFYSAYNDMTSRVTSPPALREGNLQFKMTLHNFSRRLFCKISPFGVYLRWLLTVCNHKLRSISI